MPRSFLKDASLNASFGVLPSEITPRAVYEQRRQFLKTALATGAASFPLAFPQPAEASISSTGKKLDAKPGKYVLMEKTTPQELATTYNNFYEFSTRKEAPAVLARGFVTQPWTITIEGEVKKSKVFDLESLLKLAPLEERVYRLRCVEGWSMVVPWVGYSLATLLKQVEPTGNAKYVEFISLADPKQMPGLNSGVLDWPYVEGLRMDEAMHPLTLLTLGMYGETLPPQNGAPVRLTVPWKYGFKSAKSIVRIRLVEKQPATSWNKAAPREYGFYSNVNPQVDHPRWSQATERRLGEDGLFQAKRKTLMFNGYADQVASLYTGMDLKQFF